MTKHAKTWGLKERSLLSQIQFYITCRCSSDGEALGHQDGHLGPLPGLGSVSRSAFFLRKKSPTLEEKTPECNPTFHYLKHSSSVDYLAFLGAKKNGAF